MSIILPYSTYRLILFTGVQFGFFNYYKEVQFLQFLQAPPYILWQAGSCEAPNAPYGCAHKKTHILKKVLITAVCSSTPYSRYIYVCLWTFCFWNKIYNWKVFAVLTTLFCTIKGNNMNNKPQASLHQQQSWMFWFPIINHQTNYCSTPLPYPNQSPFPYNLNFDK